MNKIVKIGIPMEYEDDKHIIRTGLWLKEYEVEALEKRLNEYNHLQSKIDKAIEMNETIRKALLSCSSYEKDKVEDLLFNQLDILKEDK